jgi:hypothetical protein
MERREDQREVDGTWPHVADVAVAFVCPYVSVVGLCPLYHDGSLFLFETVALHAS